MNHSTPSLSLTTILIVTLSMLSCISCCDFTSQSKEEHKRDLGLEKTCKENLEKIDLTFQKEISLNRNLIINNIAYFWLTALFHLEECEKIPGNNSNYEKFKEDLELLIEYIKR